MVEPIKSEDLNVKEVCRICLIKQETIHVISNAAGDMLVNLTSMQLPVEEIQICEICDHEINRCYNFKEQVLKSFEIISNILEAGGKEETVLVKTDALDSNSEGEPADFKKQNGDRFQCTTCGEGFQTHGKLRTHSLIHKSEEGYNCTSCDKNFKTARSLWAHRRRHCQIKYFLCPQCDKKFPFKHALDRHFQAKHGKTADFLCTHCPKTFKVKETLSRHIRTKHEGESFGVICTICGKHCNTLAYLKVHTRSHTGERPFICEFCSKGFVTKDHLLVHRRIHTGERPHKCSTCEKAFISSSVLLKHQRSHSGERPYKCHLCPKAYALSSVLKAHLKSH